MPAPVYADSGPSADEVLARVAETYRRHLPEGELRSFPVSGVDRLELPVSIASFRFGESTDTPPKKNKQPQFDGYGYGLTAAEANIGALGELTKFSNCHRSMMGRDFVAGSYDRMCEQFGADAVIDPLTLCLPAGLDYDSSRPLEWTEAIRWRTGQRVFLPTEFAANNRAQMRGRDPMITPITNGLGAGLSIEQALVHGVLELLQRDGNCTTFRAMDRGVVIDLDDVQSDELRRLVARLRDAGLDVTAKLASTEFGLVNAYVVGRDTRQSGMTLQTTACGESAHLDRERALRKAMVEYAAARSRKAFMHGDLDLIARVSPDWYLPSFLRDFDIAAQERRALDAMVAWRKLSQRELEALLEPTVFSERERVPLSSLPTVPAESISDPADRMEEVAGRLEAAGLEVLLLDYTPPGQDEIAVVRAVVPGLEGETMSYGRVGERGVRRLLDRGEDFVGIGPAGGSRQRVPLTAAAEERLGGPAWLDFDAVDRRVGQLYALYREPSSHAVPVAMGQTLPGANA